MHKITWKRLKSKKTGVLLLDNYKAAEVAKVVVLVGEVQHDGAREVTECFCRIKKESEEMVECKVCAG